MKKKIITFLSCAALAVAAAQAQDIFIFSIGASLGTDGAGIETAFQLNEHLQIRGGYGYAPSFPTIPIVKTEVDLHPGTESVETTKAQQCFAPNQNAGHILLNYYPFPFLDFYLCGGIYGGAADYMTVRTTKLPEDYTEVGMTIAGQRIKAYDNTISAKVTGNVIQPYLGIGFGRAVSDRSFISVAFDLGIRYMGTPTFSVETTTNAEGWLPLKREDIDPRFTEDFDRWSRLMRFYPTFSLRVYFNIF